MYSQPLKVRGNLGSYLHTGVLLISILWILVSAGVYFISRGAIEQFGIQKFVAFFFVFILITPALGIILQNITVNDEYIYYSSYFLPLIKRKVLISDISSIKFKRNFMPLFDPTGSSKYVMAKTDQPIVGLAIYNKQNQIIGGFNTKVYKQGDIQLIIKNLKEVNS